jgi:hypothetical protein
MIKSEYLFFGMDRAVSAAGYQISVRSGLALLFLRLLQDQKVFHYLAVNIGEPKIASGIAVR